MAAARKLGSEHHEPVKHRLEELLRDALKPHLAVGRKTTTEMLETVAEVAAEAIHQKFSLYTRRPRRLKETPRAIAIRLPEVGVSWEYEHKGKSYKVTVVGEHELELEIDGEMQKHPTLRSVATAILGYGPPIGGMRFFFGGMKLDEVNRKYRKAS